MQDAKILNQSEGKEIIALLSYDACKRYIKSIISIQQMKRRISRYDKNRANAAGDHPAALEAAG